MKITGQILKENRERKGISISEVALATKINNRTIIAMEEGDVEKLPTKTFLRGFVRAYASYLELDVESVMSTFYEEMGSTKPKTAVTASDQSPVPRQRPTPNEANEAINPKTSLAVKIGAVAGILLLVVLIVIFKNKMESYEKEAVVGEVPTGLESLPNVNSGTPSPTPTPTPDEAHASHASPPPSPSASPNVAAAVAPVVSPAPSVTPTPAAAVTSHSPTPTASPVLTPTPISTPVPASPSPIASPTPKVSPSPTPVLTPTPTPAAKPQEVILEALDSVEVDATVDGEGPKKFRLKADQIHAIKAKRKVILRFTDGGAVNLIVNGVERGVPGDLGKPARIEIP